MPISEKFKRLLDKFQKQYGAEKGKQVFYSTMNKMGLAEQIEKKHVYNFYAPFKPEMKGGKVVGTSGVLIDSEEDFYGDICTKACLKDLVEQIKSRTITMDVEHETLRNLKSVDGSLNKDKIPVSKIVEASYEENGNYSRVHIKDRLNSHNNRYSEVEGSIRDGFLTGYSIAFVPTRYSYVEKKGGKENRLLDKVALLNATYTGTPVNPRSNMTDVFFKSLNEQDVEEIVDGILNGRAVPFEAESKGFKIETKSTGGKKSMEEGEEQHKDSKESFVAEKMYKEDMAEMKKYMKAMEEKIDALTDESEKTEDKAEDESEEKEKKEGSEGKAENGNGKKEEEEDKAEDEEEKEKVEGKAIKKELAELKAHVEKYLNTPLRKGRRVEMKATLDKAMDNVSGPLDTIR